MYILLTLLTPLIFAQGCWNDIVYDCFDYRDQCSDLSNLVPCLSQIDNLNPCCASWVDNSPSPTVQPTDKPTAVTCPAGLSACLSDFGSYCSDAGVAGVIDCLYSHERDLQHCCLIYVYQRKGIELPDPTKTPSNLPSIHPSTMPSKDPTLWIIDDWDVLNGYWCAPELEENNLGVLDWVACLDICDKDDLCVAVTHYTQDNICRLSYSCNPTPGGLTSTFVKKTQEPTPSPTWASHDGLQAVQVCDYELYMTDYYCFDETWGGYKSLEACQDLCSSTDNCDAISWNAHNGGVCWWTELCQRVHESEGSTIYRKSCRNRWVTMEPTERPTESPETSSPTLSPTESPIPVIVPTTSPTTEPTPAPSPAPTVACITIDVSYPPAFAGWYELVPDKYIFGKRVWEYESKQIFFSNR